MPPCSVLVVEDDAVIRETISAILESEGYPVRTAPNGTQALRALDQAPASLVLLDMLMPGGDGWGLVRELRARKDPMRIAIMSAAPEAERWAKEIEADGCLPKPFNIEALLGAVARLCPAA